MINAAYNDKPLISIGDTFREKLVSHHQELNINCYKHFEFIKAVSDTALDMINAAYHDKPLISIGDTFREKLVSHHQAVNINC